MWHLTRKRGAMRRRNAEATVARIRAEEDLKRREADTHRIQRLTAEWRHIRETNNFATALERSFAKGRNA